jgi:hypothetical protein
MTAKARTFITVRAFVLCDAREHHTGHGVPHGLLAQRRKDRVHSRQHTEHFMGYAPQMRHPVFFPAALSVLIVATAPAQKSYVAPFANSPVVVDGNLNDAAWHSAPWSDDFVDIEGSVRPAPRFRTRVKMAWDDEYLYIGAELQEPHIWATLRQRDTVIFYDNDFEVFIDPNGDTDEYYEFEMNAFNTVWDLFLDKPYRFKGKADNSWNIAGLKTAVQIHGTINNPADVDSGWTVEIAMPWKALGEFAHMPAPPLNHNVWRINFSRVEWTTDIVDGWYRKVKGKPEDNWVWSPQGVVDMHWPEMWGFVRFEGHPGQR